MFVKRYLSYLYRALNTVQSLFFFVIAIFSLVLALVTIHSSTPITNPLKSTGLLDKLSLLLGVHEQNAIVICELDKWTTTVYTYVYERQLSDQSFFITDEHRERLLPGLFEGTDRRSSKRDETEIQNRVQQLIQTAIKHLPDKYCSFIKGANKIGANVVPILLRFGSEVVNSRNPVLNTIDQIFSKHPTFQYHKNYSLGILKKEDKRALQWFSINLLRGTLSQGRQLAVSDTAVILNVMNEDMELTFAINNTGRSDFESFSSQLETSIYKLQAYHHFIKLITVKFPGMGLYAARRGIYQIDKDGKHNVDVRHVCVNPIVDTMWEYEDRRQSVRVRGMSPGDYELVKERSGPFAGKRSNKPVANFDKCHTEVTDFVTKKLQEFMPQSLKASFKALKSRAIYMDGLLLEKCFERGLTLPIRGGSVRMKAFSDSLKHSCKVPNTEQPFACTDMMYLATMLDIILEFKQGSVLNSPRNLNGMTGDWPLAASFYIYQNGL